jgi:hypothetical protein
VIYHDIPGHTGYVCRCVYVPHFETKPVVANPFFSMQSRGEVSVQLCLQGWYQEAVALPAPIAPKQSPKRDPEQTLHELHGIGPFA